MPESKAAPQVAEPFPLSTLRHSVSHLMASAVAKLYPGVQFGFGPAIAKTTRAPIPVRIAAAVSANQSGLFRERADLGLTLGVRKRSEFRGGAPGDRRGLTSRLEAGKVWAIAPGKRAA